jgi:hypothetical protein
VVVGRAWTGLPPTEPSHPRLRDWWKSVAIGSLTTTLVPEPPRASYILVSLSPSLYPPLSTVSLPTYPTDQLLSLLVVHIFAFAHRPIGPLSESTPSATVSQFATHFTSPPPRAGLASTVYSTTTKRPPWPAVATATRRLRSLLPS